MYLGIKKFSGAKDPETAMKKIESDLLPKIKNYPGFVAYYAVKFEDGDHGGIGVFETKANVENALEKTGEWSKQNLANHLTSEPQIIRGEVLFHAGEKTMARSA